MKIGVYVGSFDPVHNGHAKVMNFLVNENYVDKLLVIPTNSYWDKLTIASLDDRETMLRFLESDNIIVDTTYSNYPYTYQVLDALKKDYPNDTFYLVIGADNIKNFKYWKNVQNNLKNYVIVLNRDDLEIDFYISEFSESNHFITIKDYPYFPVSSTKIRNLIKDDKLDETKDLIDYNVYNYIRKRNLYKDKELL